VFPIPFTDTTLPVSEPRLRSEDLASRAVRRESCWLGGHPEVEVITRDRSNLYADGGRQGAPSAVQITDRYHLVSNLSEAMERDLQQLQIDARSRLAQARYERYLAVLQALFLQNKGAWITAVVDAYPLFRRPVGGAHQHAAANPVGGTTALVIG
jgi:Transposase